jgi:hypothetical protein
MVFGRAGRIVATSTCKGSKFSATDFQPENSRDPHPWDDLYPFHYIIGDNGVSNNMPHHKLPIIAELPLRQGPS